MSRPLDRATSTVNTPYDAGPHWAAMVAVISTWPLLLVGGSVTVYRVGMAVPDWPTTFGVNMFLYDFLNSPWGVYLEHSHRLYGSVVGLACIVLAFWSTFSNLGVRRGGIVIVAALAAGLWPLLVRFGLRPAGLSPFVLGLGTMGLVSVVLAVTLGLARRSWRLGLAWLALAAVIGQGLLGGYRVRYNSSDLAMVHGCTALAFFGLMVAISALTSRRWTRTSEGMINPTRLRFHATVTLVVLFLQLVAGAWLRHRGGVAALTVHAITAAVIVPYSAWTGWIAWQSRRDAPSLTAPARWLWLCGLGQIVLGLTAWWLLRPFDGIARPVWPAQAAVRIAHQGIGALYLAAAVMLVLNAYRQVWAASHRPNRNTNTSPLTSSPRDLEYVA